jgi:hypothetical protein
MGQDRTLVVALIVVISDHLPRHRAHQVDLRARRAWRAEKCVLVGLSRDLVGEPARHIHPGGGTSVNQSGHP